MMWGLTTRSSFCVSGMVGKIRCPQITMVSRGEVSAGGQSAEILTLLGIPPADQIATWPAPIRNVQVG